MSRFKVPDYQPMEAKVLSRQIENAQKKVEEQNFVMRKNVLKYDDVMNKQRSVIYQQRRQVLEGRGEVGAGGDRDVRPFRLAKHATPHRVLQGAEEEHAHKWP
jgi:preprotein translocase subunit SecA